MIGTTPLPPPICLQSVNWDKELRHTKILVIDITHFNACLLRSVSVALFLCLWLAADDPKEGSSGVPVLADATDCLWGPLSLLFDGYRVTSPTVKCPELDIDQSPLSSPEVRKVWSYTSTSLYSYAFMAGTGTA